MKSLQDEDTLSSLLIRYFSLKVALIAPAT